MNRLRNLAGYVGHAIVLYGFTLPGLIIIPWVVLTTMVCGGGRGKYAGHWSCGHSLFSDIGRFLEGWFTPVRALIKWILA